MIRNRYKVSEAAALLGIGPWTLRRLETMGRIPQAPRDPLCGYRAYDDATVERIREAINDMKVDARDPIPA